MIYCVEDDDNIRDLVVYTLGQTGFEARGFPTGDAFLAGLEEGPPDLVLLDIMLPGEDGLSILKKLRARADTRYIPVILLTARSGEYDKVRGLDGGADDYVVKPFGMMELVSRIRAVLRRSPAQAPLRESAVMEAGELRLDPRTRTVLVAGKPVELTFKEFELLRTLMRSSGMVLTRDALLSSVWGYEGEVETRTLDVHIRSLRQKLGVCGDAVTTVRGVGYKFSATAH